MKRTIAVICSVCLVALVAFALCACTAVREADVEKLLRKCDVHKEIALSEGADAGNVRINVTTDVYAVYIHEIEYGRSVTLDFARHDSYKVEGVAEGAQATGEYDLIITEVCTDNMTSHNKNAFLIVGVPEYIMNERSAFDYSVLVETKTGAVQIEDMENATKLDVRVKTGSVYIGDCHADDISVNIDTGAVRVEGECDKAEITTTTGAVDFDLTARSITVKTATGAIRGEVEHPEHWYTISAHSNTASCNLSDRTGNGDYNLTLTTDTGSIKVRFDND